MEYIAEFMMKNFQGKVNDVNKYFESSSNIIHAEKEEILTS